MILYLNYIFNEIEIKKKFRNNSYLVRYGHIFTIKVSLKQSQDILKMNTNSKRVEEPFDDILYERGISLTSVRDRPKRQLYNNPLIVSVITGLFTLAIYERLPKFFSSSSSLNHILKCCHIYRQFYCNYIQNLTKNK